MLLHVTLRHDVDNCPGFNPEIMQRAGSAFNHLEEVAAKHGIAIREYYQAAPDHIEFMVVEAPDNMALALFLTVALPYKVETETRVVTDFAGMKAVFAARQGA